MELPENLKAKKSTKRKSPSILLNNEVIQEGKSLLNEEEAEEEEIFATALCDPYEDLKKKEEGGKPELDMTILLYDYEFEIEDKSTNGTFLNDEKIGKNKKKPLKDGDDIWLRVIVA